MIVVVTWLWGDKFSVDDVDRLAAGVRRNLKAPHRFAVVSDKGFPQVSRDVHHSWPILDESLTRIKGCFARLRMFDPDWQSMYPLSPMNGDGAPADLIVGIDLDTVVTGPLDQLFDRPEPFVIMQGANESNPCPFNGALMMLRPGHHPEVWRDFSVEAASKIPRHDFPDDQGWIWHKVPGAAGWRAGEDGVYVWHKRGWPGGDDLPDDARIVTFVNKTPRDLSRFKWVREHWHV